MENSSYRANACNPWTPCLLCFKYFVQDFVQIFCPGLKRRVDLERIGKELETLGALAPKHVKQL